jgi:hypothetical protein
MWFRIRLLKFMKPVLFVAFLELNPSPGIYEMGKSRKKRYITEAV